MASTKTDSEAGDRVIANAPPPILAHPARGLAQSAKASLLAHPSPFLSSSPLLLLSYLRLS